MVAAERVQDRISFIVCSQFGESRLVRIVTSCLQGPQRDLDSVATGAPIAACEAIAVSCP
jgi:hypothetical protein